MDAFSPQRSRLLFGMHEPHPPSGAAAEGSWRVVG